MAAASEIGDQEEMSKTKIDAGRYLKEKKIFELFNYLIGHLLVHEPADPVTFLVDLLDKCMLFRAGLTDPPLLFTQQHIESLYKSLDPSDIGNITMEQYQTGMLTMNIDLYNKTPKKDEYGNVEKSIFINEAHRRLTEMLMEMIQKP